MCDRSAAQRSLAAACATCIFRVSSFAASSSARASFTARALAALHCASRDSMASLTRASNLSASRRSSSRDSRSASAAARASARDAFRWTIRASSCAFCSRSCVIFAFCALDMARCIRSMPPIASSLFRASDLALSSSASREIDLDRAAASSTTDGFAAIAPASVTSASSCVTRLRSAADSIGEAGSPSAISSFKGTVAPSESRAGLASADGVFDGADRGSSVDASSMAMVPLG
mmetsp:Transcript_8903/g.36392  ORF Transcript_8903/g.36392 Transcript_8903/m.36392 type:complete len:234 (-) Transcript_8903:144-845(-)